SPQGQSVSSRGFADGATATATPLPPSPPLPPKTPPPLLPEHDPPLGHPDPPSSPPASSDLPGPVSPWAFVPQLTHQTAEASSATNHPLANRERRGTLQKDNIEHLADRCHSVGPDPSRWTRSGLYPTKIEVSSSTRRKQTNKCGSSSLFYPRAIALTRGGARDRDPAHRALGQRRDRERRVDS